MDIRTMQYYLAVIREGTISAAAQSLHVAQPSLSRQMRELEEELGVTLFVRGNRKITLTEEGMILRKRAEEMTRLMKITEEEITHVKRNIAGSIRVGAGESFSFHYLSRTAVALSQEYPEIRFHITSGDTQDLLNELDNGLIDFAVIYTDIDHTLYQSIRLPVKDRFGVLMRKDCELAKKEVLQLSDLSDWSVLISRASEPQLTGTDALTGLHIIGTYNLLYNASLMVEDGLGVAICFDRILNTTGNSILTFRPLQPPITFTGSLIWKKYQVFSPSVQMFIQRIQETVLPDE